MHRLNRIAFHAAIGLDGALDEVEQWAEETIKTSGELADDALAILSAPRRDRLRELGELVHKRFGFRLYSKEAVGYVEELLPLLCERVLARSLSLPDFCGVIRNIDTCLIDVRADEIVLPDGLHELWNACDWCDDSWSLDNQPGSTQAIEEVLRRLAPRHERSS